MSFPFPQQEPGPYLPHPSPPPTDPQALAAAAEAAIHAWIAATYQPHIPAFPGQPIQGAGGSPGPGFPMPALPGVGASNPSVPIDFGPFQRNLPNLHPSLPLHPALHPALSGQRRVAQLANRLRRSAGASHRSAVLHGLGYE